MTVAPTARRMARMSDSLTFVTVEDAQRIVADCVSPLGTESVALAEALGRTLAGAVSCDTDVPLFDRAMMDGYAVRGADVASAPVRLSVVGQVAAGGVAGGKVSPGTAVQINTGAVVPPGADTVVKVEDTVAVGENGIEVTASYVVGRNISLQGEYVKRGATVLKSGQRLGASQIAVAATAGAAAVEVYRQPRVAVLVTGDELVEVAAQPTGSQIRNSNGPALLAMVRETGLAPKSLGVAGDDRGVLEEKIRRGLESDCLCITGGISMGAFDFVPDVLQACGVHFHFRKMAAKPGKPIIFGSTESGKYVFALPGNPISAFVGFVLLVQPALAAMQGRPGQTPSLVKARLDGAVSATAERQSYWPARVAVDNNGRFVARTLCWRGSGDPFGMAEANAMVVQPPDALAATTGDEVSVMIFAWV